MKIRRARHVLLLFAAGFMWGFLGKNLAHKYAYLGHDDSQVIEARGTYEIKRTQQVVGKENQDKEYKAPESTPGTVGI
jgi:hypothetical protein